MEIERNERMTEYVNNLHMKVMDSGYARVGRDWQETDVCSPYTRLYFIISGQGQITVSSKTMLLQPNNIYLIPAGMSFGYACDAHMDQLYFHVHVYTADGYDLLGQLNQCHVQEIEPQQLHCLIDSYRGHKLEHAFQLMQHLSRIITLFICRTNVSRQIIQTSTPFLKHLYPLVQQTLNVKTSQKMLANAMSLSVSALTRRFKAETGMPLGQYMDELLFQKAQQLLLFTDLSIGQIADQLGFCDQFYFSRYFKQHQREAPSSYRRRLRASI